MGLESWLYQVDAPESEVTTSPSARIRSSTTSATRSATASRSAIGSMGAPLLAGDAEPGGARWHPRALLTRRLRRARLKRVRREASAQRPCYMLKTSLGTPWSWWVVAVARAGHGRRSTSRRSRRSRATTTILTTSRLPPPRTSSRTTEHAGMESHLKIVEIDVPILDLPRRLRCGRLHGAGFMTPRLRQRNHQSVAQPALLGPSPWWCTAASRFLDDSVPLDGWLTLEKRWRSVVYRAHRTTTKAPTPSRSTRAFQSGGPTIQRGVDTEDAASLQP
jgi:hypothetical protein